MMTTADFEHDEAPDEQVADEQQAAGDDAGHTPSGDSSATPAPNVDHDPADDLPSESDASSAGLDGDDAATDALRESLAEMRGEADRIAELDTGDEQVAAAEKFAEDAGKLDEQVGAAARQADAESN